MYVCYVPLHVLSACVHGWCMYLYYRKLTIKFDYILDSLMGFSCENFLCVEKQIRQYTTLSSLYTVHGMSERANIRNQWI